MSDRGRASLLRMVARRHFTLRQTYWITHDAVQTIRHFVGLRSDDARFAERIMLAVTEVNGCALCAYGHARFAMDAGLEPDEVHGLLGGVADGVPDAQLPAIAFAQHYADTVGRPDRLTWDRLVDTYGPDGAAGVLGAARTMMWGNAVGIPWSAVLSRIRGAPYPAGSLGREVGSIVGAALLTPVAAVHAGVSVLRGEPLIRWESAGIVDTSTKFRDSS